MEKGKQDSHHAPDNPLGTSEDCCSQANPQLAKQLEQAPQPSAAFTQQAALTEASPLYLGFDKITPYQQALQRFVPSTKVLVMVLSLLLMLTGLINDSFTPATIEMAGHFGASIEMMTAIVPYYLIGNSIGQLIAGPFVDRFGRKTIVVWAIGLAIALNFWLLNTDAYWQLVLIRVLQGFVFSAIGIIPSIVLKDIFTPRDYLTYSAWTWTAYLLAPALAPIIGGYLYVQYSWQAIFNFISLLAVAVGLFFILRMPETLDPLKAQPLEAKRILKNFRGILKDTNSRILIAIEVILSIGLVSFPTLLPAVALQDYGVAPQNLGWFVVIELVVVALSIHLNRLLLNAGVSPGRIWWYATLAQLGLVVLDLGLVYKVSSDLAQGADFSALTSNWGLTKLGAVLGLNFIFHGFIGGNLMGIFMLKYSHITGTAYALIGTISAGATGVVVWALALVPRYYGATILIVNSSCFVLAALLTSWFYVRNRSLFVRHEPTVNVVSRVKKK